MQALQQIGIGNGGDLPSEVSPEQLSTLSLENLTQAVNLQT